MTVGIRSSERRILLHPWKSENLKPALHSSVKDLTHVPAECPAVLLQVPSHSPQVHSLKDWCPSCP